MLHPCFALSIAGSWDWREVASRGSNFKLRHYRSGDNRLRQALELLKTGKVAEATPLLEAYAADKSALIAKDKARVAQDSNDAAVAWRNLGAIALLHEPWKAREAYAKAVQLDPDNPDGLDWNGELQLEARNLDAAEKSYRALLRLEGKGADEDQLFWARSGLGDIFVARGKLPEALKAYGEARAAMERLTSSDPSNAGWQRDLSASYHKIGDVLVAQGNLAEALKSFRAGLAIAERLASADPSNAQRQLDLSISHNFVGNALVKQGYLAEALKSYGRDNAIVQRLAALDPGNAEWQRDLSISYEKIADVLVQQSNNVLVQQSNLAEALEFYRLDNAIVERLASSDPGNADWQRDLSVSYNKIGDVLVAQGNLAEALKSHRASLAIRERLASSDSGNAQWQRDLAVSNERIGEMLVKQGDSKGAVAAFERALGAYQALLKAHPDDVESLVFSVVPHVRLAGLDQAKAREHLQAALAILEPMAAADRLDAERRGWIGSIKAQLAALDHPAPAK
jgi:tetratricopeptide (TPR) repeat protein